MRGEDWERKEEQECEKKRILNKGRREAKKR